MRQWGIILATLSAVLIISPSPYAQEWKKDTSIGIRGPFISPLFKGKNYAQFRGVEPFKMGWDLSLELKYGVTRNVVFGFTLGRAVTYDDTSASSSQSFKLTSKSNAYTRLNGYLTGVLAQYYLYPGKNTQPYLLFGLGIDFWNLTVLATVPAYGPAQKDDKYKFSDLSFKVGAGMNFWITDKLSMDLQARMNYSQGNLSTSGIPTVYGGFSNKNTRPFKAYLEPSVSISYHFGGALDTDKDGVHDKDDACPDTPKGCKVDAVGCPLDSDADEICDGLDQCPDTPMGCIVDAIGCPLDTDSDGVCDGLDKCANTPPGTKVDSNGCPLSGELQ